jgi:hypothetical protein
MRQLRLLDASRQLPFYDRILEVGLREQLAATEFGHEHPSGERKEQAGFLETGEIAQPAPAEAQSLDAEFEGQQSMIVKRIKTAQNGVIRGDLTLELADHEALEQPHRESLHEGQA